MENLYKSFEETHVAELKREMEILTNTVMNGGLTPQKYDWFTGQLQGLRLAERLFMELAQKYHTE